MNSMKSLILLAVLAAGAVQALPQPSFDGRVIKERCKYINDRLPKDGMMDSQAALNFALEQGFRFASKSRGLLESWDDMLKNECSAYSVQSIAAMNRCKESMPEAIIAKPLKAFADKCLNVEQVSKRVETMSARMHKKVSTDLIDADFVADFRKHNPGVGPLNLDYKALDATKAVDAIVEAFKRDFIKTGIDLQARDKYNPHALRMDINERLLNECTKNVRNGINIATEIAAAGELWEGGVEAMIASLKPHTQAVLFRYTLCANIYEMGYPEEYGLVQDVIKKLDWLVEVPMWDY